MGENMKQILTVALFLFAVGCAKERNLEATVTGADGRDGANGTSCSIQQQESGALVSCSDNTQVFISNGTNGSNAENCEVLETETGALISCPDSQVAIYNGQDGAAGQNGSDATASILDYSANSCTQVSGTSSYVKKNGGNYSLYTSSNCHSNTKFAEVSEGEAYFASSTTVMVHAGNVIRAITFN